MKKILIILIALAIGTGGGYFAYKFYLAKFSKTLANFPEPFMWGVTMGPSDLNRYSSSVWQKQISTATDLGVDWIRLKFDSENEDPFKRNDEEIKYLTKANLRVVLIIEQDASKNNANIDHYKDGYDDGFKIASHYKGKVKFYQMINEGGGGTIRQPTMSGQTEDQFDEEKYKIVTAYLRGVSEGIAKADPDAWRIVNMGWTHVGYLDKIVKDKIEFDVIGIDWYGWMGSFGEKKLENGQLLFDKLKSYKKPLIFMEVNADSKGKIVYPEKQAAFISEIGAWAWQNKDYVKGFFVLSLFDGVNNAREDAEYFGIVEAKKNPSGTYVPGKPRESFYAYQELIKKYAGQ